MLSIRDVAEGAAELELDADGVPRDAVVLVDLSGPAGDVERATAALARTARVVVGICPGEVRPALAAACAFVLAEQEQGPCTVAVPDLDSAADLLVQAGVRNPRAAATLMPLLRLTSALPMLDALVAESFAYSMLLAGEEFAQWRAGTPAKPLVPGDGEPVLVSRQDDRLDVVLNRPASRNAYSREMRDALVEALTIAALDPALSVQLRGNGPSFCSGGHLAEFGSTADVTVAHHVRLARSAGALLHRLRERTTAELQGACIGAGIELPAFAGTVVAHEDARFRLPELAMGLVPGAGGTVSITHRIGRWRLAWMVLSGAEVDVATALRWGLVDEVPAVPA